MSATVAPEQLRFEIDLDALIVEAAWLDGQRFRRKTPAGPARLLRALVRSGLSPEAFVAAAELALVMDAEPVGEER
jgi:hypothetical protein